MEARICVDRPPVRHGSIQLAIDRQLSRPTNLVAQLRILVVQLRELGSKPVPRRPNSDVEQLGAEVLLVLAGQIIRHSLASYLHAGLAGNDSPPPGSFGFRSPPLRVLGLPLVLCPVVPAR